ncbi:diguanylate cyclase domain-containing protein [Streptomyces sp. NPDC056468]|uniref:diguanylate cyclase domain-containing protein n=1 Tax=Streptomyces sp. NPDC056468 TaxID=3345830 RepID=UPI00369ADA1C
MPGSTSCAIPPGVTSPPPNGYSCPTGRTRAAHARVDERRSSGNKGRPPRRAAVGRLGGDEFSIVLELPAARREVRPAQLVQTLRTPVARDDDQVADIAASIGAAACDPSAPRDLIVLTRAADVALYVGKRALRPLIHQAAAAHAGRRRVRRRPSVVPSQ